MILNLTIYSLSASFYLSSPMVSPISSTMKSQQIFNKIHANYFFTSFLLDHSNMASLSFAYSTFSNFLESPLAVNNNYGVEETKIISKNYTSQQIREDFILTVIGCNFINCSAGNNKRGGAIYFVKDYTCEVRIYSSTFENCKAENGDGGAIFVCRILGNTDFDSNHTNINYFNSSYCCYSKCTATGSSSKEGYGPVMFIFANLIAIYYNTIVECPAGQDTSYGAQIDLKSKEIYSSYINSTKGKSKFCSAVEYRDANTGDFKFQTFVDLTGGFLTSFTAIDTKLEITFCNYVNNTIVKPDVDNQQGAFIYVRNCNVVISNFCFVGIQIPSNNDFSFVYFTGEKKSITLSDSWMESNIQNCLTGVATQNVNFYEENKEKKTNLIELLNLGPCQGNMSPPPTIFSDTFSPTMYFSQSSDFSESAKFSQTHDFSNSIKFSNSNEFSNTQDFSETQKFSNSKMFSDSNEFSNTQEFSNSKKFSNSKLFSDSNEFLNTQEFSKSKMFSDSHDFTKSDEFMASNKFTKSQEFSESDELPSKFVVTQSNSFTPSNSFTASNQFTPSNVFSHSGSFSESMIVIDRDIGFQEGGSGKGLPTGAIVGIAVAAAAVVAAALIAFFVIRAKKRPNINSEGVDMTDLDTQTINTANPIYGDGADDPFKEDFDNNQ